MYNIFADPLLVTLKSNLSGLVFSLATDFYAHQLTRVTIRNTADDLNRLSRVFGRELTAKEISNVDKYWREKHRMASYALAYLWMLDFGAKNLKLSPAELDHIHIYSENYNHMRFLAQKMGAVKFMENYAIKPQLIVNP